MMLKLCGYVLAVGAVAGTVAYVTVTVVVKQEKPAPPPPPAFHETVKDTGHQRWSFKP